MRKPRFSRLFLLFLLILWVTESSAQSFTVGLIADCQYCNCDYSERWNNDYQQGLPRLQEAVDTFNTQNVDFAVHLGDFIDRYYASFDAVSPIFNSLKMPHYHVLGNHDFSVADSLKTSVPKRLNLAQPYYSISKNDWVFIVLDGTDISLYRTDDSTYLSQSETTRLNYLNNGRTQALPWNGAVGNQQLLWLETQLKQAESKHQKVVVLCHFPVLPEGDANLWNDLEIVQLLEKHTEVKAFINGHHHPGNYVTKNNIHYLTLQGMVRSTEQNAFAIITVFENKIVVKGFGREPNRILIF